MKNLWLLVFFSSSVFAQTAMDDLRWFLRPQGQEVLISIDDLHDERLAASPEMDFGFELDTSLNLNYTFRYDLSLNVLSKVESGIGKLVELVAPYKYKLLEPSVIKLVTISACDPPK